MLLVDRKGDYRDTSAYQTHNKKHATGYSTKVVNEVQESRCQRCLTPFTTSSHLRFQLNPYFLYFPTFSHLFPSEPIPIACPNLVLYLRSRRAMIDHLPYFEIVRFCHIPGESHPLGLPYCYPNYEILLLTFWSVLDLIPLDKYFK